ncbi:MAG: hypothetical protein KGZ58_01085 [Ignavibacteriales bacterium]|nr:hypothetical protein [Ignavibacteriales bacterium]
MDSKALAGIITLGMLGLCGFCGLIGSIKQNREAKVENTNVNQPVNISTPLPKEDFVAIKKKTDVLLGMSNTTTYTIDELKPFDQVRNQLKEIPKEDKISKKPRL